MAIYFPNLSRKSMSIKFNIRKKRKKINKCDVCTRLFKDKNDLGDHFLSELYCKLCKTGFSRAYENGSDVRRRQTLSSMWKTKILNDCFKEYIKCPTWACSLYRSNAFGF